MSVQPFQVRIEIHEEALTSANLRCQAISAHGPTRVLSQTAVFDFIVTGKRSTRLLN